MYAVRDVIIIIGIILWIRAARKQLQDKDDMASICCAARRNEEVMHSMHLKEVKEV